MFGLGTWEILLILIAALVFIGPSKLPALARTMGKGMRDLKRAMAGFEDDVRSATQMDPITTPDETTNTVSQASSTTDSPAPGDVRDPDTDDPPPTSSTTATAQDDEEKNVDDHKLRG